MKIDPSTFALVAILMPLVPSLTVTIVGFFMKKWIDTLERSIDKIITKAEIQDKAMDELANRLTRVEERLNQLDRRRH